MQDGKKVKESMDVGEIWWQQQPLVSSHRSSSVHQAGAVGCTPSSCFMFAVTAAETTKGFIWEGAMTVLLVPVQLQMGMRCHGRSRSGPLYLPAPALHCCRGGLQPAPLRASFQLHSVSSIQVSTGCMDVLLDADSDGQSQTSDLA